MEEIFHYKKVQRFLEVTISLFYFFCLRNILSLFQVVVLVKSAQIKNNGFSEILLTMERVFFVTEE